MTHTVCPRWPLGYPSEIAANGDDQTGASNLSAGEPSAKTEHSREDRLPSQQKRSRFRSGARAGAPSRRIVTATGTLRTRIEVRWTWQPHLRAASQFPMPFAEDLQFVTRYSEKTRYMAGTPVARI